ncbi:MAG: hypothetical protein RBS39_08080 [Phycisphaerales bacterium]|nr:hypothetical protein [Phycisphaerales bacterium]
MTTQRVSREQILTLFRDAKLWAFASIAQQYLAKAPEDHAMRFALAAALARLGLPGPARGHLAALPDAVRRDETVAALAQSLRDLQDSEITPAQREAFLAANLTALREHHPRAHAAIEPALAARPDAPADRWLRASDGNIVRVLEAVPGTPPAGSSAQNDAPPRLDWLADHAGFAREVVGVLTKKPEGPTPPLTIIGLRPPLLALEIAERTQPSTTDGYAPAIRIIELDRPRFIDALMVADLAPILSEPRVSLFVGDAAIAELSEHLHARLGTKIAGPVASLPGVDAQPIAACIQQAEREQNEEAQRRRTIVQTRDAARHPGALADRPLRVLIPTHLHSTFVRHASADIAHALRQLGHEPRLLIEPSPHELLSGVAYLRALDEFDPDLIISINYPRSALWGLIPPNIPLVCWVQDAMPHLFQRELGASLGPADFFVGHMHSEFFDSFAYPRERTLRMPVLASTAKFHDGPIDPVLAQDLACDIAHMGNQSDTPEEVARQSRERLASFPPALRAFDDALPHVRTIAENPLLHHAVRDVTRAAERSLRAQLRLSDDAPLDAALLTPLVKHALLPFADRVVRHQTLAWAAEIARSQGLRFHIYGRGWDRHATLAPFARGTLDHAEPLRAAYQSARITLHASISTNLHQRVMECALSGGLPLCRLHSGDLQHLLGATTRALLHTSDPDRHGNLWSGWSTAAHEPARAACATFARLGLGESDVAALSRHSIEKVRSSPEPTALTALDLLGDLADTCFASMAQLTARLEASADHDWRSHTSHAIADRVRARCTYESQIDAVLSLVRESAKTTRRAAA